MQLLNSIFHFKKYLLCTCLNYALECQQCSNIPTAWLFSFYYILFHFSLFNSKCHCSCLFFLHFFLKGAYLMRTSAAAFWLTDLCSFSLSSLCTRVVLMLPAHVPINSTYKVKGLFNDSWDKNEDWAVLQSSRKRVFSDFREIVGNIFSLFPFPLVSCLAVFLLIVCPFIKFSPLLSLENTCHLLWTWLRSQKRGIFLLFLLSLSSFSSTSQWSFSVSEILLIACLLFLWV